MISSAFSSFFSTRKPAEVVAGLPPRQSSGRAGGEELNRGRPRALDGEDGSVGHAAGRRRQWHQALMLNESDDDTTWPSSAKSGDAGSRVRPQRLRRAARRRRGACPVARLRLRKLLRDALGAPCVHYERSGPRPPPMNRRRAVSPPPGAPPTSPSTVTITFGGVRGTPPRQRN